MSKGRWVTVGIVAFFAVFLVGMLLITNEHPVLGATIALSALFAVILVFAVVVGKMVDEL